MQGGVVGGMLNFLKARGRAFVLVGFGAYFAALFARIMNYAMSNDEQLYVPPADLLGGMRLYEDFFYNHVPGSAWLFYAANSLTGGDYPLLASRLVIFLAWIFFAAALFWLIARISGSRVLAIAVAVIMLTSDYLLGVTGVTASNNFLPLCLAFAGLGLFAIATFDSDAGKEHLRTYFASGVLLSLAAAMKASAVAFIAPSAVAIFFLPKASGFLDRLKRPVAAFAGGGVAAALPTIAVALRNPETFIAHVAGYHTGPHIEYWTINKINEPNLAFSLGGKMLLSHQIWFSGSTLVLIALVAIACGLAAFGARRPQDRATPSSANGRQTRALFGVLAMLGATVIVATVFAFTPTPAFPQYFAGPLIVAPLIIAAMSRPLSRELRKILEICAVALAIVAGVVGAPRLVQHLPKLATPSQWETVRVHNAGAQTAAALTSAGVSGKVATFMPVYLVEGALEGYPEFITGQFVYRTGDLLEADLRRHFVTTSPSEVAAMLALDPPAGILIGFHPDLEAPLRNFAAENGYEIASDVQIRDRYGEGVLYVRKDAR